VFGIALQVRVHPVCIRRSQLRQRLLPVRRDLTLVQVRVSAPAAGLGSPQKKISTAIADADENVLNVDLAACSATVFVKRKK